MSLGCARCGDCCDPVMIERGSATGILDWFRYWDDSGQEEDTNLDPTVRFMYENMHETGGDERHIAFTCDRFDTVTRLCTAHDDAPPMCKDFPWYGHGEAHPDSVQKLPPRCSYALDAAPGARREDARPLIPLTVRQPSERKESNDDD